MTSKLYHKVIFEDIQHTYCTEYEINLLCNMFERIVKKIATTHAHIAEYNMRDFPLTKEKGVSRFNLLIERKYLHGVPIWYGTFRDYIKIIEIIATLEAPE